MGNKELGVVGNLLYTNGYETESNILQYNNFVSSFFSSVLDWNSLQKDFIFLFFCFPSFYSRFDFNLYFNYRYNNPVNVASLKFNVIEKIKKTFLDKKAYHFVDSNFIDRLYHNGFLHVPSSVFSLKSLFNGDWYLEVPSFLFGNDCLSSYIKEYSNDSRTVFLSKLNKSLFKILTYLENTPKFILHG